MSEEIRQLLMNLTFEVFTCGVMTMMGCFCFIIGFWFKGVGLATFGLLFIFGGALFGRLASSTKNKISKIIQKGD